MLALRRKKTIYSKKKNLALEKLALKITLLTKFKE